MNLLRIAIIGAFFVSHASATTHNSIQSRFDIVKGWFDEGVSVAPADLSEPRTGRCFHPKKNNDVYGSVLAHISIAVGPDPGPGFPKKTSDKMITWFADTPDYYDDWSGTKASFANGAAKSSVWKLTSDYETTAGLNWALDFEPNKRNDVKLAVKYHESTGYYILMASNLIKQKYPVSGVSIAGYGDGKMVDAGQTLYTCYYFDKVSFK